MKNATRSLLVSCLCFAVVGDTALRAADAAVKPSPTIPAGKVETQDLVLRVEKERDEAKAQVAALTTQNQQQQLVAEYYKAVAEKNDAVLRIVGLQQQLTAVTAERDALKTEVDALKAKPAPAKETAK